MAKIVKKSLKKPVKTVKKSISRATTKVAKTKPKKTVRTFVVPKINPKPDQVALDAMVAKVRPRGFVTETELLQVFPEVEYYVYDYELTLERLQRNSIRIIEDSGGFLDFDSNTRRTEQLTAYTLSLHDALPIWKSVV